jgi:UDP-N-acetylmuramoylalanine--D-glutamate ligase
VAVARYLKIPEGKIKKSVESFKGVEGRLEYLRAYKGVKIYNDTTATTPEATVAGLEALAPLSKGKKVILIAGGTDKTLDPKPLADAISKYAKELILLPGSGTDKLLKLLVPNTSYPVPKLSKSLKEAVNQSLKYAKRGDVILFSPGFSSFEMFQNEYDRGDQFAEIIKGLK